MGGQFTFNRVIQEQYQMPKYQTIRWPIQSPLFQSIVLQPGTMDNVCGYCSFGPSYWNENRASNM